MNDVWSSNGGKRVVAVVCWSGGGVRLAVMWNGGLATNFGLLCGLACSVTKRQICLPFNLFLRIYTNAAVSGQTHWIFGV
jgi:hypothetical protein